MLLSALPPLFAALTTLIGYPRRKYWEVSILACIIALAVILPHIRSVEYFLAAITALVSLLVFTYSRDTIFRDKREYWFWMNIFLSSMILFTISYNLLIILTTWEILGICSWALIRMGGVRARRSALRAYLIVSISDIFLIAAAALIWHASGSVSVDIRTLNINHTTALLIAAAAAVKSALFPFSPWLLEAMEGPAMVSALLHSATMVKAGLYLAWKFSYVARDPTYFTLLYLLGTVSAIMAFILACFERNIKRILAYSTIGNLSVMFCCIGRYNTVIIPYIVTHAFSKACLFLFADVIAGRNKDIFYSKVPGKVFLFLAVPPLLSISGIFPFPSYAAKHLIFPVLAPILSVYAARMLAILCTRITRVRIHAPYAMSSIVALSLLASATALYCSSANVLEGVFSMILFAVMTAALYLLYRKVEVPYLYYHEWLEEIGRGLERCFFIACTLPRKIYLGGSRALSIITMLLLGGILLWMLL